MITLNGRVMLFRRHSGLSFGQILCGDNKQVQFSLNRKDLGTELYSEWAGEISLGLIISICGNYWYTQKGVKTLSVCAFEILRKPIKALPSKFAGINDAELRYRKRYLDLLTSAASRKKFKLRSDVVRCIREFFWSKQFIEVETPILQNNAAGASAQPFVTHHNALNTDFYLRISPETYLKRVIAGGIDNVFEIGKSFRNEGMDPSHLQEFTMVEWYYCYKDYLDNIEISKQLIKKICLVALDTLGTLDTIDTQIEMNNHFTRFINDSEIPVLKFNDLFEEHTGIALSEVENKENLLAKLQENKKLASVFEKVKDSPSFYNVIDNTYKLTVRKAITAPVFIINQPTELCPLAKPLDQDANKLEMFQLIIDGWEIVKGYTELTDAIAQRAKLQQQQQQRESGDNEAMMLEEDFLEAMEYGMPPMSGVGLGIDRFLGIINTAGKPERCGIVSFT